MTRGSITGPAFREWVLFIAGIGIILFEVLGQPEPRLVVLALAGGMVGLPGFLYTDRKFLGTGKSATPPEPPATPVQSVEPS